VSDPRIALLDEAAGADGADAFALAKRLDSTEVIVRIDQKQAAVGLSLVNLVARLIPNVRVDAVTTPVAIAPFGHGPLTELARRVTNAARPGPGRPVQGSYVIDVGLGRPHADLYVAADEWSLVLSPVPIAETPEHSSRGPASVAASALATGEIIRRVLPELPGVRLSDPFHWNLVDYRTRPAGTSIPNVHVDATLFGAGSVGSSLTYALLIGAAHGRITAVDADSLRSRNKLRYPLWIDPASGKKVAWLASFSSDRLQIIPAPMTASAWIDAADAVEVAVAAVDNGPARRDIVDLLARTTLNAGVDGLQMHVATHHLADGFACVYCPYVDLADPADETDVYVELTGLSAERVARLLGDEILTAEDIGVMRKAGRLRADDNLIGGRIIDLARDHLYAQATAKIGVTTLAVSAPHVSAMAGALLAAELLKISARSEHVVDRRVDVDCSGYPTGFTSRPLVDRSGRCLCHHPVRQRLYRDRWS